MPSSAFGCSGVASMSESSSSAFDKMKGYIGGQVTKDTHRDVKTDNVLVRQTPPGSGAYTFVLTDFGQAKRVAKGGGGAAAEEEEEEDEPGEERARLRGGMIVSEEEGRWVRAAAWRGDKTYSRDFEKQGVACACPLKRKCSKTTTHVWPISAWLLPQLSNYARLSRTKSPLPVLRQIQCA